MAEIEPVYQAIGRNLRALRRQHKLSQQDLAILLNFRYFTSISDIERGRIRIQLHTLVEAAELFGVPVEQLMAREEEKK